MDTRIDLLLDMERHFDIRDEVYFRELLSHGDYIIRTRAVCILADISGENAIHPIGNILLNDVDHLVRHEAAFSLGQLGFTSAIPVLSEAVLHDCSFFVRHEAAIALGVIGSEDSRIVLEEALKDDREEVRESAMVALSNLDYIQYIKKNNKFTKMTGG